MVVTRDYAEKGGRKKGGEKDGERFIGKYLIIDRQD